MVSGGNYSFVLQESRDDTVSPVASDDEVLIYSAWTVKVLKAELGRRGLVCSGNKPELFARLKSDNLFEEAESS